MCHSVRKHRADLLVAQRDNGIDVRLVNRIDVLGPLARNVDTNLGQHSDRMRMKLPRA
jgi:hypothetical protein